MGNRSLERTQHLVEFKNVFKNVLVEFKNVLSQVMSFTIVKFFYILFTTVKAFYQRQIPSVTTAIYHTIKAGLLAEVYACAKKKPLKSG